MAVDGGLQIGLAHPLEGAHEEGIDRHQGAGVRGLDVPLAELGAEALQKPDLLALQFDAPFGRLPFEPEQAFVLGGQAMAQPYAPDAARGHFDALEPQLLLYPCRPVAGVLKGMGEDGGLDLGGHPVGMRAPGSRSMRPSAP